MPNESERFSRDEIELIGHALRRLRQNSLQAIRKATNEVTQELAFERLKRIEVVLTKLGEPFG